MKTNRQCPGFKAVCKDSPLCDNSECLQCYECQHSYYYAEEKELEDEAK